MKTILAIDFGGTRSRAALFDDELRMICRAETLSRVEEGMDAGLRRLSQIGSIIDRVRYNNLFDRDRCARAAGRGTGRYNPSIHFARLVECAAGANDQRGL